MKTVKKKEDLVSVKIRRSDKKRIKKWAVQRDIKFYQLITLLADK